MTGPVFAPVDEDTGDLLDLIGNDKFAISTDTDYDLFVDAIKHAARTSHGTVRQNIVRPIIAGKVFHKRVGPFYRRAICEGLLAYDGQSFEISEDHSGGNAGRPTRVYTWVGGAL